MSAPTRDRHAAVRLMEGVEANPLARRSVLAGMLAFPLIGLLGGCSDSSTSGSGGGGGKNATLKVGLSAAPASLDPLELTSTTEQNALWQIYNYLYFTDGSGLPAPGLAESYEVSDDGLVYTFALRQGVLFHNGDPFTADDVKFSIERYADPDSGSVGASSFTTLESITVVDDHTVEIAFNAPFSDFIPSFCHAAIVPQKYITDVGDAKFREAPVGTGPFKVESHVLNEKLVLTRNDDFWGDKAGYAKVEITYLTDNTARVNALRSGQVDFIDAIQPQSISSLGDAKILTAGSGLLNGLNFDMTTKDAPYQDKRVRMAIDHAIDKDAIRKSILLGRALPAVGALFEGQFGYAETGLTPRAYDPDQARKLLAEAGYADGFELKIVGPVSGRYQGSGEVVQAVAGYLEEVGIKPTVEIQPWDQWIESLMATTKLGVAMIFNGSAPNSLYNYVEGCLMPGTMFGHGSDEKLLDFATRLNSVTSEEQNLEVTKEVSTYLFDEATHVDLYSPEAVWATSEAVEYEPYKFVSGLSPLGGARPA